MTKLLDIIARVPPLLIDGALYVFTGFFAFLLTQFGTDEAAKYVAPPLLFWLKVGFGALANATLNLKMFRSTAFADYLANKKNVIT